MAGFSDATEADIANYIYGTTPPTRSATLAIALLTSAPDDTSTGTYSTSPGTEVANSNGYARVALNPSDTNWIRTQVSGVTQVANGVAVSFPAASGGAWGTVTHFAVVTSSTYDSGKVIGWGALTASKTINDTDTATFPIGSLIHTID